MSNWKAPAGCFGSFCGGCSNGEFYGVQKPGRPDRDVPRRGHDAGHRLFAAGLGGAEVAEHRADERVRAGAGDLFRSRGVGSGGALPEYFPEHIPRFAAAIRPGMALRFRWTLVAVRDAGFASGSQAGEKRRHRLRRHDRWTAGHRTGQFRHLRQCRRLLLGGRAGDGVVVFPAGKIPAGSDRPAALS
ncbi:hypothetical protein SDC9_184647 [bioreactor metagenome]|uniref:Uncharacterized protein n=1 Tax=bioreactor metagenome TaxID=1076179 RepID=A0A645HDN5_9ZZZZ